MKKFAPVFAFVFLCSLVRANNTNPFIYFSMTGDTVLYVGGGHGNSEGYASWNFHIARRVPATDSIQLITWFTRETYTDADPHSLVSPDTLTKYKLTTRGYWHEQDTLKEFQVIVHHWNDSLWGSCLVPFEGKAKTIRSDVQADLFFRDKLIYATDTFQTTTVVQSRNHDAPERIVLVRGWKMEGTDKYLVYITKLVTIYTKDGTCTGLYHYHEMRFVNY